MALLSTPCIVLVSTDVHKLVLSSRIPNFELNFRLLWHVADSRSQVNKSLRVSLVLRNVEADFRPIKILTHVCQPPTGSQTPRFTSSDITIWHRTVIRFFRYRMES